MSVFGCCDGCGAPGGAYGEALGEDCVAEPCGVAEPRCASEDWNAPATGVKRHAAAGTDIALKTARETGLDLPGILG